MPHRVHGVMRHMAVYGPIPSDTHELNGSTLANADNLGGVRAPLCFGPASAVAAGYDKLVSMQMDGVIPHG